ncbi:hypothetical protein ACPCIR_30440 [Mycobacterium sp. NPDC051198]
MYLRVDPSQVPPVVDVCEQGDFTSFKVVLVTPEHASIDPRDLTQLAGRSADDGWRQNLTRMLDFAATRGWLDDSGRIRAHIEIQSGTDGDH